MGYKYEYEEVGPDIIDALSGPLSALIPGEDPTVYKCTIYDEDTGEELVEGLGNSKSDAK